GEALQLRMREQRLRRRGRLHDQLHQPGQLVRRLLHRRAGHLQQRPVHRRRLLQHPELLQFVADSRFSTLDCLTIAARTLHGGAMKKPLRWWYPALSAIVALGFGLFPYIALNFKGKMPPGMRDRPWPLEIVAAAATALTLVFAVRAFRERRARAFST